LTAAVTFHRHLALRPTSRAHTRGEDDGVGAIDGGCHFIDAGSLEVADNSRSASTPDIGSMIGVADKTDNVVASGRDQRCEPEGDLVVSACVCVLQAGLLLRVGPTWGLVA
jgi:hypothetical protein